MFLLITNKQRTPKWLHKETIQNNYFFEKNYKMQTCAPSQTRTLQRQDWWILRLMMFHNARSPFIVDSLTRRIIKPALSFFMVHQNILLPPSQNISIYRLSRFTFDHSSYSKNLWKYYLFCYDMFYHHIYFKYIIIVFTFL